jgi:deazaflavin-dependent oxidoreductase (nitroreductase family)
MWYNPLLIMVLHLPLHPLLSGNMLVITYTGRKSGQVYRTPVNYVRDGQRLLTSSYRSRTWWRNLRGGAPVALHVQGREVKTTGQALEDEAVVAEALLAYLKPQPGLAKYFEIGLDANGQPDRDDVARAAQERVMIQFQLNQGK